MELHISINEEKEKKNMEEKIGKVYCPVNGWDCPYYATGGICTMYPASDPVKECDDFAYFWSEDDDYICYD